MRKPKLTVENFDDLSSKLSLYKSNAIYFGLHKIAEKLQDVITEIEKERKHYGKDN